MKRFYSHYTFIHPNIYLKNHIVEMDSEGHIIRVFPFEKEVERTEFFSGLLEFIHSGSIYENFNHNLENINVDNNSIKHFIPKEISFDVFHEGRCFSKNLHF